ncbi:MAG: phosphinothricin acetyltransferase [Gemmatimonadetes bacterium]|nr:phosphinothricin acetyltransferase [Gemmatimonadota bacterium]
MIRAVTPDDSAAIRIIHNHYVENTVVTFEENPISREKMRETIDEVTAYHPWLVYERDGDIAGYAYASRWQSRCSYRYSAESTIYLAPEAVGRGSGTRLYTELISILQGRTIHSVIGGIALPNPASIALHEKLGFEKVAHFKEVGWKFDRWIDVGYWELIFDALPPSSPQCE